MSGSGDIDLPAKLPSVPHGGRLWVAFSGGLDSTVLLHWLWRHIPQSLHAVHVHHGLQPSADAWVEHCERVCGHWSVPLRVERVRVEGIADHGLEAAARQSRYRALSALLTGHDVLVTAHHRTDQAETLLLQLLRGGGPHGLAGMPESSTLGSGRMLRPLLRLSREQLLAYARAHALEWVEDPSNEDTGLRRNYLRHEVVPLLQTHWPEYEETLQRSAGLQAEAAGLLDQLAAQDLDTCAGDLAASLSVGAITRLAGARRRNLLRYWLRQQDLAVPNQAQMRRIEQDMLTSREDANPLVTWSGVELRRYRDALLAMPVLPSPPGESLSWDLREKLLLPAGCGELVAERAHGAGLRLENASVEVRFNQTGERIRPVFSKHHKRLKHLCQEAAVPPWVRERLPLIYHGQRLAAVADAWLAADYAAGPDEQGWRLRWLHAPAGWPVAEAQADSGRE